MKNNPYLLCARYGLSFLLLVCKERYSDGRFRKIADVIVHSDTSDDDF